MMKFTSLFYESCILNCSGLKNKLKLNSHTNFKRTLKDSQKVVKHILFKLSFKNVKTFFLTTYNLTFYLNRDTNNLCLGSRSHNIVVINPETMQTMSRGFDTYNSTLEVRKLILYD